MAAAAVSAADVAYVARVPAVLDALRSVDDDAVETALRELRGILAGASRAPVHAAAIHALLSAGLVPLLLSLCTQTNPSRSSFVTLVRATHVSEAARDQVRLTGLGLTGFNRMLGVIEHDASLAPIVTSVMLHTACSASVKAAVFEEVGLSTRAVF